MIQPTKRTPQKKNGTPILICKRSFFSSGTPAHHSAMKRARRERSTLIAVAVLAVCAVVAGTLYTTSPVQAQDAPIATETLAEAPVRVGESIYMSVIPFETITYMDAEMFIGETAILSEGRDGLRRVTEAFKYEDDGSVTVTSISSELVAETVAEAIAIGTLERPKTASYGTYIWPANGKLYSDFGRRSGGVGSTNHKGIDISGNSGDSIYAADGGEVIRADSVLSGFGLLVQILHDNGDVTYYAHNSDLLVEVGELVCQGQEIAKMGSTGTASGVHLHFEIRVDGKPVDPMNYLP